MKTLQRIGLSIFILGFTIFNVSFFWQHYHLDKKILEALIPADKHEVFFQHSGSLLRDKYSSNFELVADLDALFDHINQYQSSTYGISTTDIEAIHRAQRELPSFSLERLQTVFDTNTVAGKFKLKAFSDYGSWLEGRQYSSEAALKSDIEHVANNIAKYSITSQLGFDQYLVKDLKYSIAKASSGGIVNEHPLLMLLLTYGLCIVGALLYIMPKLKFGGPAGIKNDGTFHHAMKNKGWLGQVTGGYLIAFYIVLYFFPEYMTSWVVQVDPVSNWLKGSDAGRFFLYGFIYTLCIAVMGVRMIIKYRHSNYQITRTISVMFFQTAFAFLLPEILIRLNKPYFDFKNIWPLDYDFFFDNELNTLVQSGGLGVFMLVWGIALIVLGVPIFVYFFGKRWYCSWVCGCGGLAETLGDPYRQLSDKSLKAWKIERWMIHGVLVFAVVMTVGVLYTYFTADSQFLGFINTYQLRSIYGAWIGAGFAGVVGTGFYPIMGNRVWCRFGCPLAAYLGLVQRFKSRFRITTNGGQCISCGNCSTYCEMGIDVRWYAQRGQNIVRSSCVGCGVCSAVCPRGVLNLENRDENGRFGNAILIGNNSITLND